MESDYSEDMDDEDYGSQDKIPSKPEEKSPSSNSKMIKKQDTGVTTGVKQDIGFNPKAGLGEEDENAIQEGDEDSDDYSNSLKDFDDNQEDTVGKSNESGSP